MGEEQAPALDPLQVASWLFEYIPIAAAGTTQDWPELWPGVEEQLKAYLVALEAHSGARELARRSARHLERLILDAADLEQPFTIGATLGVRIDVDRPIADVAVPQGIEQLHCGVEAARQYIGSVQLPAVGGGVAGRAIADTIAADLAWPLMLWYFRIGLPRDSRLQERLLWLMRETRPLRVASQLAGLTWPLIRWQFRDGLLREPRLLARLFWLMVQMRPLHIALQLVRTRPHSRRSRVKKFLWDAARQLVREDGLVTATSAGEPTRTAAARVTAVITEGQVQAQAALQRSFPDGQR